MSIILMPTKDDTSYDLLWKAEGCACKESSTQSLDHKFFLIQIFSIGSQILFFFNIMSFKICFQERNKDELKFH